MNPYAKMLDSVISDAIEKGAIISGWHALANGKIVIESPCSLPRYHINAYDALDSLIHRYNLIGKYRYLYSASTNPKHPSYHDNDIVSKNNDNTELSLEKRSAEYCDQILLNSNVDFLPRHYPNIYHAIDKAHMGRHLSQNDFLMLISYLLNHYNSLYTDDKSVAEKEKIRKAIRFFTKIKYRDYNDHL